MVNIDKRASMHAPEGRFPEPLLKRAQTTQFRPALVTDQTSAHDPANGYLPEHWSVQKWQELRKREPDEVALSARESIANHVRAILGFKALGWKTDLFTSALGAQLTWTLPFGLFAMFAVVNRFNRAYEEAANDLGASPWQRFRHVTLPHTWQGVLAGSVLVFLPAVGDFASASLLGGPEEVMIGNLIQQQFQASDNWPFGAALTVAMMAFLMIFMLLYLRAAAREAGEAAA